MMHGEATAGARAGRRVALTLVYARRQGNELAQLDRTPLVTSPHNPLIKEVRRAVAGGSLTAEGWLVAEGFHLLEEALRSGRPVRRLLVATSAVSRLEREFRQSERPPLTVVADRLFDQIASTQTTQGVIALVEPARWSAEDLFRGRPLVAVLDGIQDPGNAGAILRAAEAFGATGAIFLIGTAGAAHPKTLRAAAGSSFRLPVLEDLGTDQARALLAERGLILYAAAPGAELTIEEADFRGPCAIVFGSEGRGVSAELEPFVRGVRIPTHGVESLNVAVAAGIILFEARRQRRCTT
jgi:TrmH family RNA methyltransferase